MRQELNWEFLPFEVPEDLKKNGIAVITAML